MSVISVSMVNRDKEVPARQDARRNGGCHIHRRRHIHLHHAHRPSEQACADQSLFDENHHHICAKKSRSEPAFDGEDNGKGERGNRRSDKKLNLDQRDQRERRVLSPCGFEYISRESDDDDDVLRELADVVGSG